MNVESDVKVIEGGEVHMKKKKAKTATVGRNRGSNVLRSKRGNRAA